MAITAHAYQTFIRASPEQVWQALTDADLTARYWGHRNESDWEPGSTWRHVRTDGSGISDVTGTVVEASKYLDKGGKATVVLNDPGTFDRITAVVANVDGRVGARGYLNDGSKYSVKPGK